MFLFFLSLSTRQEYTRQEIEITRGNLRAPATYFNARPAKKYLPNEGGESYHTEIGGGE
jgi:hypothetical protein